MCILSHVFFFGNYLSNRIVHFAHLEMQLAASKNTFFLGAAWCDVSGYWELGCFSQKVFWSFSLKKSLNQYLSIPTVQCGHWAAIIFISDIGQQSANPELGNTSSACRGPGPGRGENQQEGQTKNYGRWISIVPVYYSICGDEWCWAGKYCNCI